MAQISSHVDQDTKDEPSLALEILDARGRRTREDLEPRPMVIGRSEDATIRLNCETVSRRHAEISVDDGGRCRLKDLNSNNGTRVNGHRVKDVDLHPGDRVEIGSYELRLVAPEATGTSYVRDMATMIAPLPVDDSTDSRISTLVDVPSPKIDTTHLSILNRFAERIREVEDGHERLDMLCELMVRREFHAKAAVVVRLSKADVGAAPEPLCEVRQARTQRDDPPHLSRSLLAVVRGSEAPALASHLSSDPGAVRMTMVSGVEESAAVACPVRSTPEALDVLYVVLPSQYGTGEWLTLVAHAAQTFLQAEVTRENQKQREAKAIFDRELARASEIQRGLVPEAPELDGLDIAIGFEPCRSVGGDYVDVLPRQDGTILLAIADVCGKGLPAAMVASTIHSMVHTCERAGMGVAAMMEALNDHLTQYLDDRSFVTMASMILDPTTGQFEIVNAGHPAPTVIAPDGGIVPLQEAKHFPLGVMPCEFHADEGTIDQGHVLSMFTDGLTELTDENDEELGPGRITAHIRDIFVAAGSDLDHIARELEGILDRYLGGRSPLDDRTFLLARRP
jgi:serine phosphatase RsbU (regulator of sigma subunit)